MIPRTTSGGILLLWKLSYRTGIIYQLDMWISTQDTRQINKYDGSKGLEGKSGEHVVKRGEHCSSKVIQIQETEDIHSRRSMHGINDKFKWYCEELKRVG